MKRIGWLAAALISICLSIIPCGCGPKSEKSSQQQESGHGHERQGEHGSGESGHDEGETSSIHLAVETQQALGITVAPAKIKPLEQALQVTGQIAQDTDRIAHVHAPQAGTLSEVRVRLGERVEKDSVVAVLRSNQTQNSVDIVAPRDGLILGINAVPGTLVDPLTSLMTIADLSQVWATFDLYEQDIALAQVGQRMEVGSVAYPDRVFSGKVVFVSPQVDQHTRTMKVRAQVENPDDMLKLGMFVTGMLYAPTADQALVIPHAALQRVGEERMVFVQTGPEAFEPRKVRVGHETPACVQILEGLKPEEQVVAAGSFHLKAEFLKGTLEEGHAH